VSNQLDGRPLRREAGTVSPARHACSYCVELQRAANDAERMAFAGRGCVERGGCSGSIRPTAKQGLTRTAAERQNRPVVAHPRGR